MTASVAPVSPFTDMFNAVDAVIAEVFATAAQGMSAYVVPIGWVMLGITLLVWAFLIMEGSGHNVTEFVKKMFLGVVVIQVASALYGPWVIGALYNLPNELSNALSGGNSATSSLDVLAGSLDQLVIGVAQSIVAAFKSWNIGGAVVLFVAMCAIAVAGSLLELACVFNMVYAKIGVACLLAVGPFFVMCLLWSPIKNWFFSWLNTIMYFSFLQAFATLMMLLFIGIANRFMNKLSEAFQKAHDAKGNLAESVYSFLSSAMTDQPADASGVGGAVGGMIQAEFNILSVAFQMVLIFVPLFLVAMEMRTMVASMTGGSGGSFGSGVVNVVSTMWRGGWGRHQAGKGGAD
ncbi:MAG TPA: type IV secretion system protein [Noviherbaspirillum sp.]|nr:type IV secretion system protein [Noviherbaspirillum sp.]